MVLLVCVTVDSVAAGVVAGGVVGGLALDARLEEDEPTELELEAGISDSVLWAMEVVVTVELDDAISVGSDDSTGSSVGSASTEVVDRNKGCEVAVFNSSKHGMNERVERYSSVPV
jgi:hypothetical protein